MSNTSVQSTVDAYVAAWNHNDAAARRDAVRSAFADGGHYRDPVMAAAGHDAIAAMLGAVQEKFPGFVLRRTSPVDHHGGGLRFAWTLGPAEGPPAVEGVDFCCIAEDGRLASVVGFIDRM